MSRKIYAKAAHGLKGEKPGDSIFSKNHFASSVPYSIEIQEQIAGWGLTRVAGNSFICESSKDFWQVKGNKIVKLVGNEVDAGESIPAASENHPASSIAAMLDGLDF